MSCVFSVHPSIHPSIHVSGITSSHDENPRVEKFGGVPSSRRAPTPQNEGSARAEPPPFRILAARVGLMSCFSRISPKVWGGASVSAPSLPELTTQAAPGAESGQCRSQSWPTAGLLDEVAPPELQERSCKAKVFLSEKLPPRARTDAPCWLSHTPLRVVRPIRVESPDREIRGLRFVRSGEILTP